MSLARIALTGLLLASGNPAAALSLDDLAWLAGCWRSGDPADETAIVTDEQWMYPSGNLMPGMARTRRGASTLAWEFLRIAADGNDIDYVAQPSGQPQTAFRLVSGDPDRLVFENPAHDFPQRIVYQRQSRDRLAVWIEGKTGPGATQRMDFDYRRVACGSD